MCRHLGIAAALALLMLGTRLAAAEEDAVARGAYLVRAGGCISCHTAVGGQQFAGGRALATPFGTFYSPNITPDPETGIGRWSGAQFLRAVREGVRPDGANYFPVFPYPSFTGITDGDALAIKEYLFSLPPVRRDNRAHDVAFPFSWRFLQYGWKLLYFTPGPFVADSGHSASYNRGAYIVTALAHCGECHTPRNILGAVRSDWRLAGTPDGPEGQPVPNITPDPATGIGRWDRDDLLRLLKTGSTPEETKVKEQCGKRSRTGSNFSPTPISQQSQTISWPRPRLRTKSRRQNASDTNHTTCGQIGPVLPPFRPLAKGQRSRKGCANRF
jgi:mono/diheme cytochrome c family protein